MDFNTAFQRLLGHEGALSMDPKDRGNWTGGEPGKGVLKGSKYGISAASYPGEDIAGLTLERAREIYLRDYWTPAGCERVPHGIRFDLFDMAVNSGVKPAIKTLQKACGATPDGILGPKTIKAVEVLPDSRAVARFNGARLAYMADAPTWPAHGRGWARRIASNLLEA